MPTPTEQFSSNPYGFARKHGIIAPGDQGQLNEYKSKAMMDGSDTFYQVSGQARIQWLRLSLDQSGAYIADVSTFPKANSVPIYYLPWNRNELVRITLRHSQKAGGQLLDQTGRPIEPNIFLTAAVNGCSVFVEGPAQQPTVYHANAAGGANSPGLDDGDAVTIAQRIGGKVSTMRDRYKTFSTAFVKPGRDGDPGNYAPGELPGRQAKETNVNDYLLIPTSELHANETDEVISDFARRHKIKKKPKVGNISPGEIKISDFMGTIFGVRNTNTGNWSFYFQKLVEVAYYQKKHFYSKASKENSWQFKRQMQTLTCQPFWPDGGGHLVVRY